MVITAQELATTLKARRCGEGWVACCPAHADSEPSLSISAGSDGKVLVHCFGGCEQERVIEALMSLGLWGWDRGSSVAIHQPRDGSDEKVEARTASALELWEASYPAAQTLVERYLISRGLRIPVPQRLRFHPRLMHPDGAFWPAMVGLISDVNDKPLGIHRTFLARNGLGKAPAAPSKMMLGPSRGGSVRLGHNAADILVGEGIETCLTGYLATGRPAWAALSATGLQSLRLPGEVSEITILVDLDDSGVGLAAAERSATRWRREGRRVRLAFPEPGMDFNDMLFSR